MSKKNKIKAYTLVVLYSILIITEILILVPFHRIQVFKSQQNVPHTEVIGNGYSTIFEIASDDARISSGSSTARGKRVNMEQLVINVSLTTLVAAAFYILLVFRNNASDAQSKALSELIKQNELLSQQIEKLTTKRELKNLPYFDINSIAFADEETQQAELAEYVERIVDRLESEIHNVLMRGCDTNEQLSFADAPLSDPPYIDINVLTFADEETAEKLQKQYAEDLCMYVKSRMRSGE